MSAQPHRQLHDEVYSNLRFPKVLTSEDWCIIFNASRICRVAWAFDAQEQRRSEDDALLMLDLTIEAQRR